MVPSVSYRYLPWPHNAALKKPPTATPEHETIHVFGRGISQEPHGTCKKAEVKLNERTRSMSPTTLFPEKSGGNKYTMAETQSPSHSPKRRVNNKPALLYIAARKTHENICQRNTTIIHTVSGLAKITMTKDLSDLAPTPENTRHVKGGQHGWTAEPGRHTKNWAR